MSQRQNEMESKGVPTLLPEAPRPSTLRSVQPQRWMPVLWAQDFRAVRAVRARDLRDAMAVRARDLRDAMAVGLEPQGCLLFFFFLYCTN